MSKLYKHISCLILAMLSLNLGGQDIPELPKAREITEGKLQNGVSWYIVSNSAEKGFADAAIVRKGTSDRRSVRSALSSLPHFRSRRPCDFLSDHGISYGPQGWVSYGPGTVTYGFGGIPVYSGSVVDSTLLLLLDLVDSYPADQAVIISGDVDAAALKQKLETLSLMVNPREKREWSDGYEWKPTRGILCSTDVNATSNLASIRICWRSPRVGRDMIATVQPLVSEVLSMELGIILKKRITASFREADIPLASVSYEHEDSSEQPGDEKFQLEVHTSSCNLREALTLLASTLAELDLNGASEEEFIDAGDQVESEALRDADNIRTPNSVWVSRCALNWLYGASLASNASRNGFFSSRKIETARGLELFNGFQSAILDPDANVSLHCSVAAAPPRADSLASWFRRGWDNPEAAASPYHIAYSDTLGLFLPPAKPSVKIRHEALEPVSGGTMYTLSNGIRVIYRKTDSKGEFEYAMMLRGGFTELYDLRDGESAFVGDMLYNSRVAGMSGTDFHNVLSSNGITISTEVSLSDLTVRGTAPSGKMELLLSSLVSLANMREPDIVGFDYYRRCQSLYAELSAMSTDGINSAMDSLMCPDYKYSVRKSVNRIGDDLPVKAEAYFAKEFAKVNDGVIVFAGDIPQDEFKKQICLYFGDLRTSKKAVVRPRVNYPMMAGWSTYTSRADECPIGDGVPGINVAMSAKIDFSRENYLAFMLACTMLETYMTRELAGAGQYFTITPTAGISPVERMGLFMNFRSCNADGLPSGVEGGATLNALPAIRAAVSGISSMAISDSELSAAKNKLADRIASGLMLSGNVIDAVLLRYSEGKDIVTDYKKIISATGADAIRDILKRLGDGCGIEYIIL